MDLTLTRKVMLRLARSAAATAFVAALWIAATATAHAQDTDNDGLAGAADLCPTDARNRCAGSIAIDTGTGLPIRVNANSSGSECAGAKLDCAGDVWAGDFGFNTGRNSGCNLGGGGEGCVINGISTLFGCDSEETEDLFQCERWDEIAAPDLTYSFNVPNSRYIVNLFFANTYTGTAGVGQRIVDIYVEGGLKYDNFDQVASAGGSGIVVVRSVDVNVTDGNGLQIQFVRQSESPAIKAIEVIAVGGCTSNSQCNDNNPCTTDTCIAGACQFSNNNASCNDGLACTSNDVCSSGSCSGLSNCPSGQVCNVQSGVCDAPSIAFGKSLLQGETISKPTSLQFGPDGKLYVAQQDGVIHVYTIARQGPDSYVASSTQIINLIYGIPNRNDDGSVSASTTGRLVTGMVVAGTAQNPVIYIASGDPRIGGGSNGSDKNLDTNSGIIARLTWNGSSWQKLDLVRGLPRSEENHQGNGMYLDAAAGKLYIAYGGNTNMGAPSNNFVGLPEYALSAAILSIDLAAIGNTTYDIPTLDDEDTTNVCTLPAQNFGLPCSVDSQCDSSPGAGNGVCESDFKDPFGGNNGKNQARIVAGGPVQVYAPGFRNPYDIVKTAAGRMYTIDNGPNSGWGDVPVGEGTATCTNAISEPGVTRRDGLHYVTGAGYYGGHPNPTRANTANTFNPSNPQSPVPAGNAIECDYRTPGTGNGSLYTWGTSTNGLAEYTSNNFGGQLTGSLLTASFDDQIWRIQLNAAGSSTTSVAALFSTVTGSYGGPLDVYASRTSDPFPGSVWVADHANSNIVVYEPTSTLGCTGADNPGLDEDGDGYTNADEIDNGTNPCSSADIPGDWDGDFISDLNDSDDDNDSLPDTSDKFALDADNGTTTAFPLLFGWENDDPPYGGLRGLGFTGLMTNGSDNYLSLFSPDNMTAGGAAGVVTVDGAPEGDALGNLNTQQYGFQFGVDASSGGSDQFTVRTRVVGPFLGTTPEDFQSMGLFIGTGDQSNYFKVVTSANGGAGGVETLLEVSGVATAGPTLPLTLPGPEAVDLFLTIDRNASTVQAGYAVTHLGATDPVTPIGSPVAIPSSWLTNPASGLAIGVIATSRGAAPPFAATWDFVQISNGSPSCSSNGECDDGNACTVDVCDGGTCTNDPGIDGTTCDDGLACTTSDACTQGVCGGAETCPRYEGCDAGTGACGTVSGDPDNDGLAGSADPCPGNPRNLCYGPVAVNQTTSSPIRINANNNSAAECSGAKTDCAGGSWSGDVGFNTGTNQTCNLNGGAEACVISGIDAIFGCDDESTQDLFQCERYDPTTAPELQYSFNVLNGEYLVNLYFANTYTLTATGGSRVFDIQVEGATVYPDFDQIAAAGGSGIAVVRSAIANVTDGNGLQIQFLHAVENPAIKAIEVLTATPACTIDSECDDGSVCNGTETCNPTIGCIAGTPLACNDGNACNGTETCNPTTGCVAGTPPTCDDGNVCNGTETCNAATGCVPGTPLTCNDGDACNGTETCNTATGCAAGTPLSCNDGDACNGLESCMPATGCQAGTPPNCSDGDPCTTDSCLAGQCVNSGSCPPTGNVAIDAASVRTACVGAAGDSITLTGVPVGSQPDRILVVTVGAEENNGDCNLGLASASATYGGIVMSKAVNRVSNTSSWRACNGIFYLLNPPAGTANVVINFPTTANASLIDNRHAGAFVLYNAAQQAPEVTATAGANATTNPVNTAITPLTGGGVVIDVVTRGNTGSYTTTQTGQVEQWDLSCASSSSATSIKPVGSPGQTLLGWSHTNPIRYAHSLAAFAPSGVAVTTSTSTTTTTTTTLVSSSDAAAFVTITPTGDIDASTYNANSYNVRNDSLGGESITQVRIEFTKTLLPDLVYDPAGTAGDREARCLIANTGATATGFVAPTDPCTTPYSVPYELGYRAVDVFFTDFDPGETFGFSADADPTSIRGTSGGGADSSGSISGLELTGATVTVWFDDGSQISGETFLIPASVSGSRNVIKPSPPPAPTISALGVATPATVTSAAQTIRVSGPAGASLRLMQIEAELDLNGGAGYDVDSFEANRAVAVSETSGMIGAGGFVDIPVTLTRTNNSADLNYFAAVVVAGDGSGQTGLMSNVIVLEYVPTAGGVQVDSASLRSACVGTAGDSITISGVPVGSQANRVLVVTIGAEEDNADCDLNLASATASYGGVFMSKAVTRVSDTTEWRACNGIFYMLNPPTGTADVVVNFPATTGTAIDNRHAAAFVIFGAAQSAPEAFSTAGGDPGTDPTSTAITPLTTGGIIVDVMTRGNTGLFATTQAGQSEWFELSCTSSSSATSTKPVTAGGQSTSLGWDHSNPNRYAHSLAAFGPAP